MATLEHHRGASDQDLIGVHGDVLFADPLGVRTPQAADLQPGRGQGAGRGGYSDRKLRGGGESNRDRRQYDERFLPDQTAEEDQGILQTWFGFLFAPGSNCCSMRVKDEDAAKAAAATGRPPTKFPAPRGAGEGDMGGTSNKPASGRDANYPAPSQEPKASYTAESMLEEPGATPSRRPPSPLPPEDRGLREDSRLHQTTPPSFAEADAPRSGADAPGNARSPGVEPQAPLSAESWKPTPRPPDKPWVWPAWSLNSKDPCIEVYVVDDDGAPPRWCMAEPQFRVVNKDGNDAYLCAEYEWDDEFYVQDFGPHQVRKRGQTKTVSEGLSIQQNGSQNTLASEDTKRVDKGPDQGKGMAGFLEDSR